MREKALLQVRDLCIKYKLRKGGINVVSSINLSISEGEIIGLAGESGCGKTTFALSLIGLLPKNSVISGEAFFDGAPLPLGTKKGWGKIRGRGISYISQDALAGLNPIMRVGRQVEEAVKVHERASKKELKEKTSGLLKRVRLSDPFRIFGSFPHQLSGGQRQRALLAIAVACKPKLLIADEPTTALDVTTQAGILNELKKIAALNKMAILYISHDLSVISGLADRAAIMYGGNIVEMADVKNLFNRPMHPYTKALLRSIPELDSQYRLEPISGSPPSPGNLPHGCAFFSRCGHRTKKCREEKPALEDAGGKHYVACYFCKRNLL